MGITGAKHNLKVSPSVYAEKLSCKGMGEVVHECSYEKWVQGASHLCGFRDRADHFTPRTDFRAKGFLLRPDVTDGRYIAVSKESNSMFDMLRLDEVNGGSHMIHIPPCNTSGKMPQKLMTKLDYRRVVMAFVQQQTTRDGVCIVGCHDNLAVIQSLDRKECYVPEFFFVDLATNTCIGKFATKDCELQWYECYISPDKSRIILRPDVSTIAWTASDCVKTHTFGDMQVMVMRKFPDSGGYVITFDNRHGNGYLFRAKEKTIQLFDLDELEVIQNSPTLTALPAPIRQIKCSPSGEFLAVRCTFPTYSMEYETNVVGIISTNNLDCLFYVNTKGPYYGVSEVINLQVFPRFSTCDSAVAVMKNGLSKRKILIHKLPSTCTNLLHICRKVILRSVLHKDIEKLPSNQIDQILQSTTPSAQIRLSSGQPGTAALIRTRGPMGTMDSFNPPKTAFF